MRAELLAAVVLVAGITTDHARADNLEHEATPAPRAVATADKRDATHEVIDPHTALSEQLVAQTEVLARTQKIVTDKIAAVDAARVARVRAAYRVLSDPLEPVGSPDDRMAAARRRAAAKLLLARDASEHALLVDEAAQLRAAETHTTEATIKLPQVHIPDDLAYPARGSIARHFGTFTHERSKATLSRRGVDLEVDDRAPAIAPSDGIVRYAGPIRGLDRGVIIEHGNPGQVMTVIAKLGELAVVTGSTVHKGDRLGRAARHRVYFEVRANVGPGGLPIDPESIIAKSTDKSPAKTTNSIVKSPAKPPAKR